MSVEVFYKGNSLGLPFVNATKKLNTAGTWLEDDIELQCYEDPPILESLTVVPSNTTQTITNLKDPVTLTVATTAAQTTNPLVASVDFSFIEYGKQYYINGRMTTQSHYRYSGGSDIIEFDCLWTAGVDMAVPFNIVTSGDLEAHPFQITFSKTQIKAFYPEGTTISRGYINNAGGTANKILTFTEKICDGYMPVIVNPAYTAHLHGTGNNQRCYVSYNNTNYYSNNPEMFNFSAGEYLTLHVQEEGIYITINGIDHSENPTGPNDGLWTLEYTYQLPSNDIDIYFDYEANNFSGIEIRPAYVTIYSGNHYPDDTEGLDGDIYFLLGSGGTV